MVETTTGKVPATPPAGTSGLPSRLHSIIVVGAMNPAIHHPLWYRHHDLLSEPEASTALVSLITFPALARFTFGSCQVFCRQDQWEIRTTDSDLRPRILDIAARLFDNLLPQTPMASFAFNNESYHAITIEAPSALAWILLKGGLPAPPQLESVTFSLEARGPNGSRTSFRIEPSVRSAEEVYVAVESKHSIQRGGGIDVFSLRPLLDRFYDADLKEAQSYATALVQVLNEAEGEKNARGGR
jgi:hypothetical protein